MALNMSKRVTEACAALGIKPEQVFASKDLSDRVVIVTVDGKKYVWSGQVAQVEPPPTKREK